MDIHLIKAEIDDSEEIFEMKRIGFKALLEKYKDFDTNPRAETLERVKRRFSFNTTDQYFVTLNRVNIGYIRIQRLGNNIYRLFQMFILPDF